jgi:hypothetical protein
MLFGLVTRRASASDEGLFLNIAVMKIPSRHTRRPRDAFTPIPNGLSCRASPSEMLTTPDLLA